MPTARVIATPGTPFLELEREFDAPRDLVYRAWTDPKLIVRWLGPRRLQMRIDYWDLDERGGAYRYIHSGEDGVEHAFHGSFHRTGADPYTLLQTFEYEGAPGYVSLDELKLVEAGDKTIAKLRSVHQTVEARDAMVAAGASEGMNDGFDKLDELLAGELASSAR
ncbi:MAG: SRPBCC family protein [Candidatus Limnocylindrales bacterium]